MVATTADALDALLRHSETLRDTTTAGLFGSDPRRFSRFHLRFEDLVFDFSKQRVDEDALRLLVSLAEAGDLERRRAAFFAGDAVNVTEDRAAMHMALRNVTPHKAMTVRGRDVMPDVMSVRARMGAFAEGVRDGTIAAADGAPFAHIVNIGIGGSDLGPAMAARALSPFVADHLTLHFVANVDGADLEDTLKRLDLKRTLFIVCSKTFTTLETMTNARSARALVAATLGEAAVGAHFCAVSTQLDKIAEFGIAEDRVFGFWDWVGGRYSIWSAIGLSLMIGIGPDRFEQFLAGGADIDAHFASTPIAHNIPAMMALIEIWNRNVLGYATQAIIPYDQRLARFPAYLQQLEMESNGKHVQADGRPVTMATAPVIFGEPGTNGQHAFFQMLHQGTDPVPIDFLVAANPIDADRHHHALLVANCFAQSEALMRGRTVAEARSALEKTGVTGDRLHALAEAKSFTGNRPTSTLLYESLTPRTLGRLIALYEHKVFTQGVIWNIDSFDQWGVELGKELANRLVPIVADASASTAALDSSTAGLIAAVRELTSTA